MYKTEYDLDREIALAMQEIEYMDGFTDQSNLIPLAQAPNEIRKKGWKRGVYVIFNNQKHVYVGQSTDLSTRIGQHRLSLTHLKIPLQNFQVKVFHYPNANEKTLKAKEREYRKKYPQDFSHQKDTEMDNFRRSDLKQLLESSNEVLAEISNPLDQGINRNSSEYIRWIQSSLNQILGISLVVDGIMGPQTRNAIRRFQQQQRLVPDGIVGMKTEAVLRTALNASYPSLAQTMQRTIYGWGQYQQRVQELPPHQQMTLAEVGDAIIYSLQPGRQRVRTVQVYGHADWDTPRNPQREQQISEERAREVTNWLKSYIRGSIPTPISWDSNASNIEWDTKGFGATQLIASPTSEANRAKNRRVEIVLNSVNWKTCQCSPQRNACPGCECKMSPNCQKYTCPSKSTVKRLSFQQMWDLIIRHYYCELPDDCKCNPNPCCIDLKQLRNIFSPELLIAIFWEETGFRNIAQLPCGPAVGFGQVQDAVSGVSSIQLACQFCGIRPIWTPQEILCDDAKSVKIAGMLLWRIYCLTGKNRNGALLAYAGNNRQSIVNGWVECEKRLKEIRQGTRPNTLSEFRAALSQAAPSRPYQPQEDPCVFPGGQIPTLNLACPTNLSCEQECERQFEECFLDRNQCLLRRRKCLQNCQGIIV